MLGNLTGITNTNTSEAINKKLQDEINELKNEVNTLEGEVDALSDNVDTNVIDANTGNIDNINATSVSSTNVSATNVGATNATIDHLTVNNTVDNLNVTNGNIQNIFADDVDTNTLEADQANIDQLVGNTATIDNLTVTSLKADTVDIGTITDDIDSEYADIETVNATNVTAQQMYTDDIQADTGGITTFGSTKITSNEVNATDVNATNISASDIDTLRVDASRMTSGIFSLNKDFFINISTNVNDIGVIKMPAFDGVARLSFVNPNEVEQLTMTIINNEVEKKQILVNFSQKAGRLNGFAISANNEFLIGVNGGNISKMYYTFDTSEEFSAIPEQLPITDFPNDIQYSWLATSELGKTLCFIEPDTPTQGFEVTGMFKADSLEWTSVSIDNLDVIYNLTVRNDTYIGNDLHLKTFDIEAAPIAKDVYRVGRTTDGVYFDLGDIDEADIKGYKYPALTVYWDNGSILEPPLYRTTLCGPYDVPPHSSVVLSFNQGGCIKVDGKYWRVSNVYSSDVISPASPAMSTMYETEINPNNTPDTTFALKIEVLDFTGNAIQDGRIVDRDNAYINSKFSSPNKVYYTLNEAALDDIYHFDDKTYTYYDDITVTYLGETITAKRYYFEVEYYGWINHQTDDNFIYPCDITTTESGLLDKGIVVRDERYPDEKVDLVNVKAEDAYTADYATKALQDNNGDQIDTTYQKLSEKAQPNGYASLDANGRIPYSQLPESAVEFKGTWNASTNTPQLPTGTDVKGDMYIVNVAGTQMGIDWYVGDQAIYDGSAYQRISGSEVGVDTVNGLKDAVTIANATVNGQTITVDKVEGQTVTSDASIAANTPVGQTKVAYSTATINTSPSDTVSGPWTVVCQKYNATNYTLTAVNTSNGRTFTRAGTETYWHENKGFFYKNVYFTTDYSSATGVGFKTSTGAVNHDISVSGYVTRVTTSTITRVPFTVFVRGNGANTSTRSVTVDKDVSGWCIFKTTSNSDTIYLAIVCKPSSTYQRFIIELDSVMIGDVGGDNYTYAPNQPITNSDALTIWNGAWNNITPTVKATTTSVLTLAQYNALSPKAAGTLYLIIG